MERRWRIGMSRSEQKVVQYLEEAHASERSLTRVLQAQILMTPGGGYRTALESHLEETREHAKRIERRLDELGEARDPITALVGIAESAFGQVLALGKTPLDLIRGSGGEEKVLKNAKDTCATEALEIATYTALEQLARVAHDEVTASLAAAIREQEEQMLQRVLREIPHLTDAVLEAERGGNGSYELSDTGAADALRDAGEAIKDKAHTAQSQVRRRARSTRRVPGVARAEGQVKGIVASEDDLAIARYGKLTAHAIVEKLPELSQIELAKVEVYERRHQKRATVLSKVEILKEQEPWPGFDELTVDEVRSTLGKGDEQVARSVHAYERTHKKRSSVIEAATRERVSA
jgi:ferritin-like metal-binding protein YciE